MPRKSIKNGFKFYTLADGFGYAIKFLPSFCFKDHSTAYVVITLLEGFENKGHHVFMDRCI
jgi:hypothetical protein